MLLQSPAERRATAASRPARILEICPYPPPRAGWSMRVELVKKQLQREGHHCVVLNTGVNRTVPGPEYDTILSAADFVRKVWRYSRAGYTVHEHVNGESAKGFVRTLMAEVINLLAGKRCYLTFHAGVDQLYFPRPKAPALLPVYWLMFLIPRQIICNSTAVKEKIQEYGVPARKISVIPAFTRQYLEFPPVEMPADVEAFYSRFPYVLLSYVRLRDGFNLATLLEGFARLARDRNDVGLVIVGTAGDVEAPILEDVQQRMAAHRLAPRVCMVGDLEHDAFLTAVTRCTAVVRTPTTDGVASSVLEALVLGVPVVAAENGSRPEGVVTYVADDPADLAAKMAHAIRERASIVASAPRPHVPDTLSDEIRILSGAQPTHSVVGADLHVGPGDS